MSLLCVPKRKDSYASIREVRITKTRQVRKVSLIERIPGMVWACGQGESGQLGFGQKDDNLELRNPTLNTKFSYIIDVQSGCSHSVVLSAKGKVYTFGSNEEGALGRETFDEQSTFVPGKVQLPLKAVKISAGEAHSACLLQNGDVYVWGSFRYPGGYAGLKYGVPKFEPIRVMKMLPCTDIASGHNHLVLLDYEGSAFTIGNGENGQLGRIANYSRDSKGKLAATLTAGEVFTYDFLPIDKIWATANGTFIREQYTGKIFAFGQNEFNQLCLPSNIIRKVNFPVQTFLTNILSISGGFTHTLILTQDRKVYVAGVDKTGIETFSGYAKSMAELTCFTMLNEKNIHFITCGSDNCHALTEYGELYSWGCGSGYQLGNGGSDYLKQPTLINQDNLHEIKFYRVSSGDSHTLYITAISNKTVKPTTFNILINS